MVLAVRVGGTSQRGQLLSYSPEADVDGEIGVGVGGFMQRERWEQVSLGGNLECSRLIWGISKWPLQPKEDVFYTCPP